MYSGKKKRFTIKYDVSVRIYDGIIVRTRGPLPGKIHDKKFAEYYQIQNDLDPDEWALGDAGYQGMPKFIVPFKGELDDGQRESNKFLGRLRVIVERVYGEIKKFAVFQHPWRGKIPNQKLLWIIACNVANIKHRYYPIEINDE
jgi:hypothetical protein